MYWGDTDIFLASYLDNLINWFPVVDDKRKDQNNIIWPTSKKKFDSDLVEPGPPAMLTEKGIVLIYNSRNVPSKGDTKFS